MANDTYTPSGHHPDNLVRRPLRKSIADASSATEIIPARDSSIAIVKDWQISSSANTTITVREAGGGQTLLKQTILAGSTPLPSFESITSNKAVEIIASGAVALELDGEYAFL